MEVRVVATRAGVNGRVRVFDREEVSIKVESLYETARILPISSDSQVYPGGTV